MSPRFSLDEEMIVGHLFVVIWKLFGALLCPFLLMGSHSRRHIWNVPTPTPGRTWIHGASIGEHRNSVALMPHLGPSWRTHSSWRSHPKGSFPAPMDLPFIIDRWLDHARPSRLVLLEGELWPGWLIACRKRGIPVVVVATRKGPGWNRWQRFRSVFEWLTRDVQFLYNDDVGCLKQAATLPSPAFLLPELTIVGASTRTGDEQRLIQAWETLPSPRPRLLLAPRHLHRVDEVVDVANAHQVGLRSKGLQPEDDIWIVDTHGELAGLMASAHIVFVGGTFDTEIGGHSPAEAVAGGAHIVRGPHTFANVGAWNTVDCTEVDSELSLAKAIRTLLDMPRPNTTLKQIDVSNIIEQLPPPVLQPETHRFPLLWPLVPLWALMTTLVRRFQRGDSKRSYVVVGGLVNGGAGRTPAAAWLATRLKNGHVVSAGYRRQDPGSELRHGYPDQPPKNALGDELEMIRRRGFNVTSAPNRIHAIDQCAPEQIPIIDGGLGDPRLKNGFRIACIDAQTPHGRGPFPVGRKRLSWTTLQKVNAIWLSNASADFPIDPLPIGIPVVKTTTHPIGWMHRGKLHPLSAVQGEVDVVVGIANPDRFICTLVDLDLTIRSLQVVGDHDPLPQVPPRTILTEKDAARLPIDADVWALRMELHVDGGDELLQRIEEYCT